VFLNTIFDMCLQTQVSTLSIIASIFRENSYFMNLVLKWVLSEYLFCDEQLMNDCVMTQ